MTYTRPVQPPFPQQLDHGGPEVAGGAHVVHHDEILPVPPPVGQQRWLPGHGQEEERVPHPPVLSGKHRRWEWWEVVREIRQVAGTVVERAADDQQPVIPGLPGVLAGGRLPRQKLVAADRVKRLIPARWRLPSFLTPCDDTG